MPRPASRTRLAIHQGRRGGSGGTDPGGAPSGAGRGGGVVTALKRPGYRSVSTPMSLARGDRNNPGSAAPPARSARPAAQIGIPHSGNQRSNSGSIGSSALIWALICSSRSVERSPPAPSLPAPGAGTNGYQNPRL